MLLAGTFLASIGPSRFASARCGGRSQKSAVERLMGRRNEGAPGHHGRARLNNCLLVWTVAAIHLVNTAGAPPVHLVMPAQETTNRDRVDLLDPAGRVPAPSQTPVVDHVYRRPAVNREDDRDVTGREPFPGVQPDE